MTRDDPKDPPIEPLDYLFGLTVVDLGDIRVARGLSRRPFSICEHRNMVYDQKERRIWCKDCERNVEPFDAVVAIAEQMDHANKRLLDRAKAIKSAEAHSLISRAAKAADKAWREKSMAPACPHCQRGILPEDALNFSSVNKEWEVARRKREQK